MSTEQNPSITTWTRLESRTRSADMSGALEARIADPLWLLARQWQLGEFQGEDAGSPVVARLRAEVAPISRLQSGAPGAQVSREIAALGHPETALPHERPEERRVVPGQPLETLVEAEPVTSARDLRTAAETGQDFLRALAEVGAMDLAAAVISAFQLPTNPGPLGDNATAAYLRIVAGRVPDGNALADASPGSTVPEVPGVPEARRAALAEALNRWRPRVQEVLRAAPAGGSCWERERLEYRFAVAAYPKEVGEVVLAADEYDGGRLDWADLQVRPGATLGAPQDSVPVVRTVLPSPASYPGMPALRWWEMEDARVSWGGTSADKTDLARLLLVEYASVYANDHFLIPVDLPVGSVTSVTSLVVTDTFGERTLVPAVSDDAGWALFRPTVAGSRDTAGLLVLLPTVTESLEGPLLEEVLLLRDEAANLGWAIERVVAGRAGHPVNRHEQAQRSRAALPAAAKAGQLSYTLQTFAPEHWFPLLPVEESAGVVRLLRGSAQREGPAGTPVEVEPVGLLLAPEPPALRIPEEEVGRAGIRVTRRWQLSRWVDGSIHLWLGRTKGAGRGEGSAGLRYDIVEAQP
ncbi:hypothetical protein KYC5002_23960 [Archangium violaceum]|uniref:hypothetical protein n=1 Tax=Archangium violaceum TaxID=83451 RepID=UPI002B2804C6|nr:hypothetical protein KYC5002_23960 [Archangium gephyra]